MPFWLEALYHTMSYLPDTIYPAGAPATSSQASSISVKGCLATADTEAPLWLLELVTVSPKSLPESRNTCIAWWSCFSAMICTAVRPDLSTAFAASAVNLLLSRSAFMMSMLPTSGRKMKRCVTLPNGGTVNFEEAWGLQEQAHH